METTRLVPDLFRAALAADTGPVNRNYTLWIEIVGYYTIKRQLHLAAAWDGRFRLSRISL